MKKKNTTKRKATKRAPNKKTTKRIFKKKIVPKKKQVKRVIARGAPTKRKPAKKKALAKKAKKASTRKVNKTKRSVAKKPARKKIAKRVSRRAKATPKRKPVKRITKVAKRAASSVIAKKGGRRGKDAAFLESFVGSPVRARLLRLVLRQPNVSHELRASSREIGMPLPKVRREAELLATMGVVNLVSRGGKKRIQASSTFQHLRELEHIATGSFPIARGELIKILKSAGVLKMVVVAGVFLNDAKGQTDLLVVAGRYSEKRLERAITKIEQAVAGEVRWAGMDTKEFKYRWRMFDRFVRDILTNDHERILDSIRPK